MGWIAGDEGSATWMARLALAAALKDRDGRGPGTRLRTLLADDEPSAIVDALAASLADGSAPPAALARAFPLVVAAARDGDVIASEIFRRAGEELAQALAAVARSLGLDAATPAGFTGGAFAVGALLTDPLHEALERTLPGLRVAPLRLPPEIAVLHLATAARAQDATAGATPAAERTGALLRTIHAGDKAALHAIEPALPAIARAVELLAARLDAGGRWFTIGAGTSGRLGVLDAAELGPTFGVDASQVVARIAGGACAVTSAVEGAEDDAGAAARDLDELGLAPHDVVLGISASGRTPYVLGGLRHAQFRGAATIALACAAGAPISAGADVAIEIDTGRELVRGSTRMKAGTAQKCTLHMLSTAVMARRGRIVRGEMVAMRPTNDKLRRRARDICTRLLGIDEATAEKLLARCGWDLPVALVAGRHDEPPERARTRLADAGGNVARALGPDEADENAP
jgi:N-acetylmuramic acid 6-phosphate etherase